MTVTKKRKAIKMKVYLNTHSADGQITGQKIVEAEVLQKNTRSVIVKLPDGKIITRRMKDQVVPSDAK